MKNKIHEKLVIKRTASVYTTIHSILSSSWAKHWVFYFTFTETDSATEKAGYSNLPAYPCEFHLAEFVLV